MGQGTERDPENLRDPDAVRALEAWYRDQRETLAAWLGAERATVTLLFTDMVQSTQHLFRFNSWHYMNMKRMQLVRTRRFAAGHDCRVVDAVGDAMFLVFRRAPEAFAFARRLSDLGLPEEPHSPWTVLPVPVRIGLHHGQVNLELTGLAGRAVHYAARVCQKGRGPETWASDAARQALEREAPADAQGLDWSRREDCELPGIPGVQRLWQTA